MRKIFIFLSFSLFFYLTITAQKFTTSELSIPIDKDSIYGTLLIPNNVIDPTLVIFIAGSGPSDRNGNQMLLKNNSLKFLAEALSEEGVFTYRFDKRLLHQMKRDSFKERDVNFDEMVNDVKHVTDYFSNQNFYKKIILAGHSQGSLVALIAGKNRADAIISLAGSSRSIDEVLHEQLTQQIPIYKTEIESILSELRSGNTIEEISPMLLSIFRPSVQPFLISWMKYNPETLISELDVPILIINGDNDLQIPVSDAKCLSLSAQKSQLLIIPKMNHIFKVIQGNALDNQMSYMNPELPIAEDLIDGILEFINN